MTSLQNIPLHNPHSIQHLNLKPRVVHGHPGHYLISVTVTPMGEFGFVKNVASNLIKDLKLKP
jgi:hypothetical protein